MILLKTEVFCELYTVFPPKKLEREIWGFEISRFPGNLCRDPGNFLYISKNFRGSDIHHSDIKNALLQIFFSLTKNYFSKLAKFFKRNACEIKFFSQSVEKIEKLKPSSSKKHNKMLKIRSEMLKKNGKVIKFEKNSWENFPNPENFRDPRTYTGFPEISLKIFRFPES